MMRNKLPRRSALFGAFLFLMIVLGSCAGHDPAVLHSAEDVRRLSRGGAEELYQRFGEEMKQTIPKDVWLETARGIAETVGVCQELVQAKLEPVEGREGHRRITLHMVCTKRPGLQIFQVALDPQENMESFFYQGMLTQATNHGDSLLRFLDDLTSGRLEQARERLTDDSPWRKGNALSELADGWTILAGRCNGKGTAQSRPAPGDDTASLYTVDAVCFQGDHRFEFVVNAQGRILNLRHVELVQAPASGMKDPLAPANRDAIR